MPKEIDVECAACIICGKVNIVRMPVKAYKLWAIEGEFIQRAWPEGTATEREMLINGTCGSCFDTLTDYGDEE